MYTAGKPFTRMLLLYMSVPFITDLLNNSYMSHDSIYEDPEDELVELLSCHRSEPCQNIKEKII